MHKLEIFLNNKFDIDGMIVFIVQNVALLQLHNQGSEKGFTVKERIDEFNTKADFLKRKKKRKIQAFFKFNLSEARLICLDKKYKGLFICYN